MAPIPRSLESSSTQTAEQQEHARGEGSDLALDLHEEGTVISPRSSAHKHSDCGLMIVG